MLTPEERAKRISEGMARKKAEKAAQGTLATVTAAPSTMTQEPSLIVSPVSVPPSEELATFAGVPKPPPSVSVNGSKVYNGKTVQIRKVNEGQFKDMNLWESFVLTIKGDKVTKKTKLQEATSYTHCLRRTIIELGRWTF